MMGSEVCKDEDTAQAQGNDCPGTGKHVVPTKEGDVICPLCGAVTDRRWWDSALYEWPEEVLAHPRAENRKD